MSITFVSSNDSESMFISSNPWFDISVQNRINKVLRSDLLKYKIRDEIDSHAPDVFRRCLNNESSMQTLLRSMNITSENELAKIRASTDMSVAKINSVSDLAINKINNMAEVKAKEFIESKDFEPFKNKIYSNVLGQYSGFESNLKADLVASNDKRDDEIKKLNKDINKMRTEYTSFGLLTILGFGLMYMFK